MNKTQQGRSSASAESPTLRQPQSSRLSSVLERNIQALQARRAQEEERASLEERIAAKITRLTGSMIFVYLHVVVFGFWVVANLGWIPGVPKWDGSFVVLGTTASVEAIFLSTFVLISQNRMTATADKRADLDVQISLLSEHEVTKLVALVSSISHHLGIRTEVDAELEEIKQDVSAEAVLDEIEAAKPSPET